MSMSVVTQQELQDELYGKDTLELLQKELLEMRREMYVITNKGFGVYTICKYCGNQIVKKRMSVRHVCDNCVKYRKHLSNIRYQLKHGTGN